jgi:two-component system response regulator FixJ
MIADIVAPAAEGANTDRFKGRDVHVIDDDRDVRQSLHFLLNTFGIKAWSFACAEDFFSNIKALKPAPILLDVRMAKMDGLQVLEQLRRDMVSWPVIMITAHGDIATAVRAVKLGALEFLEKPFAVDLLETALASAFEALDEAESIAVQRRAAGKKLDELSPRELQVISVLVEGASNKSVAHRLGLSTRTVEMHRKNALAKLGVRSIAEVMALAATANRPIANRDAQTPHSAPEG